MFYIPPRKPKLAVIYTRSGPDLAPHLTPEMQERICREYCTSNHIPISHSVRITCTAAESLEVLKLLVKTLPSAVDTMLAASFLHYSSQVHELSRLCMLFQCRPTWLFSLDLVGPLYKALNVSTPEDFLLADQRYNELMES